jgi:hypothetical protein
MPEDRATQAQTAEEGAGAETHASDWMHDPARFFATLLPSLEELAAREETVKVTITLSKASVEFFKREARSRRTRYQKMIRRLLDEYVERQMQYSQR